MYASEHQKIDKTVYSTDELLAYAIYKQALDTYKETKDKAIEKYSKDLEALNAQLETVAKEFNKNIQERSTKAEEEIREQVLKKLKEEIKCNDVLRPILSVMYFIWSCKFWYSP